MIGVLAIVTCAFMLRDINSLLGMPEFVIGAAKAAMSPQVLPVAAFLIVTVLAVAAGNFWGICAIAFPVIIPLPRHWMQRTADGGAIISATAAGSHHCFFGSEATLACSATQIENVRYAQTATPMLIVPVVASVLLYLAAASSSVNLTRKHSKTKHVLLCFLMECFILPYATGESWLQSPRKERPDPSARPDRSAPCCQPVRIGKSPW